MAAVEALSAVTRVENPLQAIAIVRQKWDKDTLSQAAAKLTTDKKVTIKQLVEQDNDRRIAIGA
jgi:hypothetical protein